MLGLDWRSLALLRIGLAVVVLCDLFNCAQSLRAFYTDDGVLPREWADMPANPLLRLHLLGGGAWFEGTLLALEGVVALLLLVGWRTRAVTVAAWVLLLSRQARNPLILFGADAVLRLGLFWGMFLPLGRRCSLDAAAGRERAPEEPCYLGVAGFCLIFQLVVIYVTNGAVKSGATWLVDHTAVYYSLGLEIYARPFGEWVSQFDGLTRWLTVLTPPIELYGPLLFVLPWWSGRARLLGFTLFLGLQLGFNVCMTLGLFGPAMVVIMLPLLPAEFWTDWAEPWGRRLTAWAQSRFAVSRCRSGINPDLRAEPAANAGGAVVAAPQPESRRARWRRWTRWARWMMRPWRWLRDGVLLFLAGYVAAWDHDSLPGRAPLLPAGWHWIGWDLSLAQTFNMFGPDPLRESGWYVMCGTLENGETVDAFTGARPADFSRPASVAATYRDRHWTGLLLSLTFPGYEDYLEPLALHLGNEWNRAHPASERMRTLEIVFMLARTAPNHTREPVEDIVLWTETWP